MVAEWAIVVVLVWAYCAPFLDSLGSAQVLPGDEAEFFQSLDWTLVNSLRGDGQFPLWNPYLRGGTPYVGDPYLHVWNPLITIPILLYGVMDGFKIAIFLAYLAAGLGAWYLGATLRLGPLPRLWLALMYAFTGQAVAKWFQGHYDFVLGFAWIPWSVATLIVATRTGRGRHIVAAAFALALLFLSGNAYYSYYTLFVVVTYGLVVLVRARRTRPYIQLDGRALRAFVLVGGLALGLIALQLVPLVAAYPYLFKQADPDMMTSHSLDQVWGELRLARSLASRRAALSAAAAERILRLRGHLAVPGRRAAAPCLAAGAGPVRSCSWPWSLPLPFSWPPCETIHSAGSTRPTSS